MVEEGWRVCVCGLAGELWVGGIHLPEGSGPAQPLAPLKD